MKPIPSTAEILAFRMLERPVDKRWTDWAYEMLCAGFETENMVMLAGETEPYNQFELRLLADKVFAEFGLTWDDRELVYRNYIRYLISQVIEGDRAPLSALLILKDIYDGEDMDGSLTDFALLYWAHGDLDYSDVQYYWDGATRENIDEMTRAYFVEWLEKNKSSG
ncbi:hypothetical protein [Mucilaginibacter myungsuensis]|uniref:Uncharacterized protein n=1 Tax=Mucilaginibacter myungsuensis TaxID=649104 RepID=A0A929PX81_9SPHI|nr:hypothetical protein [Mucilaginibacter myungsuensis]MBE9662899.1 hypothetical protein [Mucilaginibacter myungsuensis]MDN3598519.1 hypothetical protein [Mucilaginibacter myungsuensis]